MKKALIVWGGWDGHEPQLVAERFGGLLRAADFEVEISDTLDAFLDYDKLKDLDLIVPVWTMGTITREQCQGVVRAVGMYGVGLAGCHGGMCDSFREDVEWQFMTGGQWISHPGGDGVEYAVNIKRGSSPITFGLHDFKVCTEQYYVHVDPAVEVLATTRYPVVNYFHACGLDQKMGPWPGVLLLAGPSQRRVRRAHRSGNDAPGPALGRRGQADRGGESR